MARRIENDCCDCAAPAYPCLGDLCPRRRVPHFYCDKCGNESLLYCYDDMELCQDCLLENFDTVEGSGE